jgi:hypothetical protein
MDVGIELKSSPFS